MCYKNDGCQQELNDNDNNNNNRSIITKFKPIQILYKPPLSLYPNPHQIQPTPTPLSQPNSHPPQPPPQTFPFSFPYSPLSTMKPAQTSITTITQGDFTIHLSIAQKQSDSGLMFNERLIILNEGFFFGYISKFDLKDDPHKIDLNKVKVQVPIKLIKAIEHDKENLVVKFIQIEKNKQEHKKWVFKMTNQKMVEGWFRILQDEKVRRAKKSLQKRSPSRGSQHFTPTKLEKPLQKVNNQSSSQQVIAVYKNSPKKQQVKQPLKSPPKIIEEEQSQNREFINPLYGYDSLQSEVAQNMAKNKKIQQTPKANVQPEPLQRKPILSPKRQNNFMKQSSFQKPNQAVQPLQKKSLQRQKPNIEFKASPDKKQNKHPLSIDLQPSQNTLSNNNLPNNNHLFTTKPRSSYVQMIEKIVKESEQRTMEKYKERASHGDQSLVVDINGVLEEFIRYDTGEVERMRKLIKTKDPGFEEQYKPSQNQIRELEEIQQFTLTLQQQQRAKTLASHLSPKPINYPDFSKEIALMLRNKRFQRQDQASFSSQQQPPPTQIKHMPFSYRYLLATSPSIPVGEREEDVMEVVADWKGHCERLMREVVGGFVKGRGGGRLGVGKRKGNVVYFQVGQIEIKLAMATLKTVHFPAGGNQNNNIKKPGQKPKRQKREQRISDYSSAKELQIEFKNYCALSQLLQSSHLLTINHQSSHPTTIHHNPPNNTNHSSRLKTPLTAIVEYLGFVALFKLQVRFSSRREDVDWGYVRQKQGEVERVSNIGVEWVGGDGIKERSKERGKERGKTQGFDGDSVDKNQNKNMILHVDEEHYARMHLQRINRGKQNDKKPKTQQQHQPLLSAKELLPQAKNIFCVDMLQQLQSFLLKDYLTKSLPNAVLRYQLIQQMTTHPQYRHKLFTPPHLITPSSTTDLTLLSGEVLEKLSSLILRLDNMEFYYLHPEELAEFFHREGVNVRYMGLAFDNLSEGYAKKMLMTEIAARVVKLLVRKTVQDVVLGDGGLGDGEGEKEKEKEGKGVGEGQQQQQQEALGQKSQKQPQPRHKSPRVSTLTPKSSNNASLSITPSITDLLNCLLGSSPDSHALWQVLSHHSQYYFKCQLNKQLINPGYLIVSLVHHCRLEVNWAKLNDVGDVFRREDFFGRDCLLGVRAVGKVGKPVGSGVWGRLERVLENRGNSKVKDGNTANYETDNAQLFNHLITSLNLTTHPLPASLSCLPPTSPLSPLSLKSFLSHHIRPQTLKLPSSSPNFTHLRVFTDLNQFPQKHSIQIRISEIKWYQRLKKKEKYLRKFEELVGMLNRFYGDFSPALGEVYDVFATFHLANGEYQDAITFAKSSLVNTLKICGTSHIKTAQTYYKLSLCYLKANKPQEAIKLLQKCLPIYQAKQRTSTQAYAMVNLKLGVLMLVRNQIRECVVAVERALEVFGEVQGEMEQEEREGENKGGERQMEEKRRGCMFEDEKTECYETLARCCEVVKGKERVEGLMGLAGRIQEKFLKQVESASNLERILRIVLTPYLQSLSPQDCALFIDLLTTLSSSPSLVITPKLYSQAFSLIKARIHETTLLPTLSSYLQNFPSILDYLQLNDTLKQWKSFEKVHERETINDFVAMMEELVVVVGEGFLVGVLRDGVERGNAIK